MNLRTIKTVSDRRKEVEKQLSLSLKHTGTYSLDEEVATTLNCENMIGVTQVPLGLAGPLQIKESLTGEVPANYYLPLATTEGALVASVNRGCKAITESGGALVNSHRVGTTRGPVFYTGSISKGEQLYVWLKENENKLAKISEATSTHLKFLKYKITTVGQYAYVRFYFDTQDAMGMNMVTIATHKLAEYIEKNTKIKCLSVAGNYDTDKKISWLNFIEHRGIKTWAEVTLSEDVLKNVLKTTATEMYEIWLAKCMVGSAVSGSLGFNAHAANILAALFLATGQDIAHVGEGSMAVTTTEIVSHQSSAVSHHTEEGLYISVFLPDLMVGTVGGGTGLATQQEALEILGVAGGNNGKHSQKLAEIMTAAVLAGEISLLASLTEGSLGRAHERLGRGEK